MSALFLMLGFAIAVLFVPASVVTKAQKTSRRLTSQLLKRINEYRVHTPTKKG